MKKIFISLLICSCTALLVYANDIPNAGVGIVLQDVNNQISVQKLLPHSNMGLNGLRPGDIITEIDGVSTENLSLKDVQAKFRGKADIKKVSAWLGHSSIGITLDTYTHVLPHHLEELTEFQDKQFKHIFHSNEKDIPDEMLPHKTFAQEDDWGA